MIIIRQRWAADRQYFQTKHDLEKEAYLNAFFFYQDGLDLYKETGYDGGHNPVHFCI